MSKLLTLCRKIIRFAEQGDPVKDAIEPSGYRENELLVELAKHYAANSGRAVHSPPREGMVFATPPDVSKCKNLRSDGPTPCWYPHCQCFGNKS